ncbi:MAG: caspase family protein [Bacteroidales bacterium]|nr:caspase family protein [Bacteroidales bacterium]
MKRSIYLFIAMQIVVLLACGNSLPSNEKKVDGITMEEVRESTPFDINKNDEDIALQNPEGDPNKYALIIAIGKYPRESGWSSISSENDVPLIKNALLSQNFKEENIVLISDNEANKEGIVNAIKALTDKVSKGDYVVVHYSGHGQQITDDNGEELDNLDEALVAFGAPVNSKYAPENYTGEMHLRDDELGDLLGGLRAKLGKDGQLLVFLDACHSGTGTRGDANVRGGAEPFVIELLKKAEVPSAAKAGEEGFGMSEAPKSRGSAEELAPFVLFAGASFDELNYETKDENGKGVGSLSYSIAKAFTDFKPGETYRGMFADVLAIMATVAPKQTPMIEGDIDVQVFGGEVVEQEPYYELVKVISESEIKISAGSIMGINKGDKLGIYKSGTQSTEGIDPEKTGTISECDNFSATLKFEEPHGITNLKAYWVFLEEQYFGDKKVKVSVENVTDAALKQQLLEELEGYALVTLDETNPEIKIDDKPSRGAKVIEIKTAAEGSVIKKIETTTPNFVEEAVKQIKEYAQAKFIREMDFDDENYKVQIELIPVKAKVNGSKFEVTDTLDMNKLVKNGVRQFGPNDQFIIKVTNLGLKNAYFNIIDIQPDGIINPIVPSAGKDPKEYMVKKGQSIILSDVLLDGFYPPLGPEMFKVFATKEPIDLTPIVSERGTQSRGDLNPLEMVISESYQNTRGPKVQVSSLPSEESGSTFNYVFTIVK